jgi:hypothetical protein
VQARKNELLSSQPIASGDVMRTSSAGGLLAVEGDVVICPMSYMSFSFPNQQRWQFCKRAGSCIESEVRYVALVEYSSTSLS